MLFNKKKSNIEKICKNCRLYDAKKSQCSIVILNEGERMHIPMLPEETCFFEEFIDSPEGKFQPIENVKEVKFWVEDPETGEKTKEGKVKIEYPEGFFGPEDDGIIG